MAMATIPFLGLEAHLPCNLTYEKVLCLHATSSTWNH
jgi:hypothetical protein